MTGVRVVAADVGPAIITGLAALAGVSFAQAGAWLQRRSDERRRRRGEVAGVIAPTLSLISAATEQIKLGDLSKTAWYQQEAWTRLREEEWPSVRMLLLVQAAQEQPGSSPSFDDLVVRLGDLINTEDGAASCARAAWQDARAAVLKLRDARLPRGG